MIAFCATQSTPSNAHVNDRSGSLARVRNTLDENNDASVPEIEGMETSCGGAGGGSTTAPESAEWLLLLSWLFGPLAFNSRTRRDRPHRAECARRNAQTCTVPPEFLNVEGTNDDTHTNEHQRGFAIMQIVWVLAGLLVASAAAWHVVRDAPDVRDAEIDFATPYQAVLLANGSVYFGKLEGYGTERPVLTQVFYIVSQTNPETKQTANVVVKRGKEMREPDRMYLTPTKSSSSSQ